MHQLNPVHTDVAPDRFGRAGCDISAHGHSDKHCLVIKQCLLQKILCWVHREQCPVAKGDDASSIAVLARRSQARKLDTEVLAPMSRWNSAFHTVEVCAWSSRAPSSLSGQVRSSAARVLCAGLLLIAKESFAVAHCTLACRCKHDMCSCITCVFGTESTEGGTSE